MFHKDFRKYFAIEKHVKKIYEYKGGVRKGKRGNEPARRIHDQKGFRYLYIYFEFERILFESKTKAHNNSK
jgi:hypothetical protein